MATLSEDCIAALNDIINEHNWSEVVINEFRRSLYSLKSLRQYLRFTFIPASANYEEDEKEILIRIATTILNDIGHPELIEAVENGVNNN